MALGWGIRRDWTGSAWQPCGVVYVSFEERYRLRLKSRLGGIHHGCECRGGPGASLCDGEIGQVDFAEETASHENGRNRDIDSKSHFTEKNIRFPGSTLWETDPSLISCHRCSSPWDDPPHFFVGGIFLIRNSIRHTPNSRKHRLSITLVSSFP